MTFSFVCTVPVVEALNYTTQVNCTHEGSEVELHITLTVSMHAEFVLDGISAASNLPFP